MLGISQTKERESVRAKKDLTPYLDPRAFQTVFPGTLPRWSPEMGQRKRGPRPLLQAEKNLSNLMYILSVCPRVCLGEKCGLLLKQTHK